MKKSTRVLSLFMALLLAASVFAVGANATTTSTRIPLETGNDTTTAAPFAIGETIFGSVNPNEQKVYYFYNTGSLLVHFVMRCYDSVKTTFIITKADASGVGVWNKTTKEYYENIEYGDNKGYLPAGGYYVTIKHDDTTTTAASSYSFCVVPPSYASMYGTLNYKQLTMNSGEQIQLIPDYSPDILNLNTHWRVLDDPATEEIDESQIATITQDGIVRIAFPDKAIGFHSADIKLKAQAVYYYRYEDINQPLTLTCEITAKPANISLSPAYNTTTKQLAMKAGTQATVSASTNAKEPTNPNRAASLRWETSDPYVALVDPVSGLITAQNKGTAKITVYILNTSPRVSRSFYVNVDTIEIVRVVGVNFSKSSYDVKVGKTVATGKTFMTEPVNRTPTNSVVYYSSSDTTVATVSSTGVVTGVKAGTAVITVTTDDGGYKAQCTINVTESNGLQLIDLSKIDNPILKILAALVNILLSPITLIIRLFGGNK